MHYPDSTGYYAAYQRVLTKCYDVAYDERVLQGLQQQRLRGVFEEILNVVKGGTK